MKYRVVSSRIPHKPQTSGNVSAVEVRGLRAKSIIGEGGQDKSTSPTFIRIRGHKMAIDERDTRYALLQRLIGEQYRSVVDGLLKWDNITQGTLRGWGIHTKFQLKVKAQEFSDVIKKSCKDAAETGGATKENNPLFYRLREAFVKHDIGGLRAELRYAFMDSVVGPQFSKEDAINQKKLADLRFPLEWYPATRAMQRTIHLHVGPTNSGKTYHALKRLEHAETGVYAGPLRLLAHEVYQRFNAKGKPCALITGEERRVPEGQIPVMSSCTVEMVPLNTKVDVAVIDEIQMIGDIERGWAWTQALLGVQAKEVHLCGELRTVQLVQDLCAAMGDKLEIHRYERLSPLKSMDVSLGNDLSKLEKGDCVILFSRVAIHAMKKQIETATGKRCAVVYGSLPPETRAQQAALFNEPDNDYDFLVASNAVGMGLNLSIKRIIFEAAHKYDGSGFREIESSEIKQIGGRAGRYRTSLQDIKEASSSKTVDNQSLDNMQANKPPAQNTGYVTTLEDYDLKAVRAAMASEAPQLKAAGVLPPDTILHRFAGYFPKQTPFSYILLRLHEICTLHHRFFLCRLKEQVAIADIIQQYDLQVYDRITFIAAPVALRDPGFPEIVGALARCVAEQDSGHLLDIKEINLELLEMDKTKFPGGSKEYLRQVETLHKSLTLYLWLSYRFPGVFQSQALAFHVKTLAEAKIDDCLSEVHWSLKARQHSRMAKLQTERRERARGIIGHQQANVETEDAEENELPTSVPASLGWNSDEQVIAPPQMDA